MKRILNLLLVVSVFVSLLSFVPASAETEDWIIGEFSNGSENNISEWIGEQGTSSHVSNIQYDVKRFGKESALEWNHAYGNKALTYKSKDCLGKALEYDYLYIWIYSKNANNQQLNVIFQDHTTDKYTSTKLFVDFTGWKLLKYDISGVSYNAFATSTKTPAYDDKLTVNIRNTGWEGTYLTDTHIFIDSVFFSNNDYLAAGDTLISADFANGASDVEASDLITLYASPAFKTEEGYYDDKVTVLKDGVELTGGYSIDFEYTKAFVKFDETMEAGVEYTILFDADATMDDGTVIGENGNISFTTAEKEFELSEITFSNGSTELDTLPASGSVFASVYAKNISDEPKTAVLIIGVYDKTTNRMLKMETSESLTLYAGEDDDLTTDEISLESYENCYIRAFLWDSENGMYSYGEYGEI